MLVLGLVLIVAAIALGAGVVVDGGEAATVELFGTTIDTTVAGVFFGGAATMLVFMLGVLMLVSSMGRSRRKRVARKEAKRRQLDSVAQLEQERAQLRAENERLAGQLGDGREPDTATDTTAERTAAGGRSADRDREGSSDLPETSAGRPMRESDGPSATGSHSRDAIDGGAADRRGVDLRDRDRTGVRNDTSTT